MLQTACIINYMKRFHGIRNSLLLIYFLLFLFLFPFFIPFSFVHCFSPFLVFLFLFSLIASILSFFFLSVFVFFPFQFFISHCLGIFLVHSPQNCDANRTSSITFERLILT